ncbi:MAG: undecaprenyl/decaprenyl-phosphate alpha-N-acetylglucosaminyl 1-phosphate transferase [Candidatus Moraniibacteriota bacterium]|nr:MAG: undecaprenyl/decaprenyl-phosphate alpha-N-acetylglucosaminyl 1-phosphate transferase [Candidatus Moranbacteria bacterium]
MSIISLFLPPFLLAFCICVSILFLLEYLRSRFGERVPSFWKRFGGAAIVPAFVMALLWDPHLVVSRELGIVMVGCVAILFFGLADDVFRFGWKVQFLFQSALVALIGWGGMRIYSVPVPFVGSVFFDTLPGGAVLGGIILFLWVILLMNVLNWSDGIDGLLPSIALVSSLILFVLSLFPEVNQPPLGILTMALLGSVSGLLLFNAPPAKIFSGTAGSFFLGFTLASFAVLSGTKIATALLTLLLPVLDALSVIVERLRSGRSPFLGGDFRHLHYRLRELGWSDRRIVFSYASVTALIGIVALLTNPFGKTISFLSAALLALTFLTFVRRNVEQK